MSTRVSWVYVYISVVRTSCHKSFVALILNISYTVSHAPPRTFPLMRKICKMGRILNCFMPSPLPCFFTFCCSAIPISRYILLFFTLVYLIFVAAYLITFTPHTLHNFEFKSCSMCMRTNEEMLLQMKP